MSVLYDLYRPSDSWLHRLDPRVKLLFALCSCTMLLLLYNLWLMLVALVLIQLLLVAGGVERGRITWVWRMTLPTMLMIAVLWIVFYPGQGRALLSFWFIRVTSHSLAEGMAMALRIAALAFAIFTWLFTTSQTELVLSFVSLGVPYQWGLVLAMALRYLPSMANAFSMISDAQQARALDLGKGNPIKRARAYLPITVAMLITALRTSERLAYALQSRALGSAKRRTYLHRLAFRTTDWLWTVLLLAALALFLYLRLVHGFGAQPLDIFS